MDEKYFKITLAGDLGSGKSTVAEILAERLHAEKFSTGTIQRQMASERGMTTLEFNKLMESHPEIDAQIDGVFQGLSTIEKNMIIDSRMAWHFLPKVFSVFLITDVHIAAERIIAAGRATEKYASVNEAVTHLRERKQSEIKRYANNYGVNINDLNNYDLVIDTAFVTPAEVADCLYESYLKYASHEPFCKFRMSAKTLLPLTVTDSEEAQKEIVITGLNGAFYLLKGHNIVAATSEKLIGCSYDKEVPVDFIIENCNLDTLKAWEKRLGFRYKEYPDFIKNV